MHKLLVISAATLAIAAPTSNLVRRQSAPSQQYMEESAWDAGAVSVYPIHESCNATQRGMIAAGLEEAVLLASHAKDHILRFGNSSEMYRKYFGELPPYEAIGAYDMIVNGNKEDVLFRCDNPDGNCEQEGWAGHWRGANATSETVICDLSYNRRRWLISMCGQGYTVAEGATNTFWASDLMHRLYHVPAVGYGFIEHYVETYDDVIEFAENGTTTNTRDSDVLQYFALDAYAYDIAVPGVGCNNATSISEASSTSSGTPTSSQAATQTSSAAQECHTHSDGTVHCD